jgi:hypothetical protein
MRIRASKTLTQHEAVRWVEDYYRDREKCCPDAEVVLCVCRYSINCPRHGLICVGSHD